MSSEPSSQIWPLDITEEELSRLQRGDFVLCTPPELYPVLLEPPDANGTPTNLINSGETFIRVPLTQENLDALANESYVRTEPVQTEYDVAVESVLLPEDTGLPPELRAKTTDSIIKSPGDDCAGTSLHIERVTLSDDEQQTLVNTGSTTTTTESGGSEVLLVTTEYDFEKDKGENKRIFQVTNPHLLRAEDFEIHVVSRTNKIQATVISMADVKPDEDTIRDIVFGKDHGEEARI